MSERHPAVVEFDGAFDGTHLPQGLPRDIMAAYSDLHQQLLSLLPNNRAGLTRAIHDLWRSKNEAVYLAVRVQEQDAEQPGDT